MLKEARTYAGDLRKVIEMIVDKSGLVTALELENTDEARGRVENIKEFLGVVDEFSETHDEEDSEVTPLPPRRAQKGGSPCACCAATRWPISSNGCGCVPTWTP